MPNLKNMEKELFELVNQGFMYNGTAPRWINGRAYFYLISKEEKRSVILQCSKQEYRSVRSRVEERLRKLHGQVYYPKSTRKEYADTEYIAREIDKIKLKNLRRLSDHVADVQDFITKIGLNTGLRMFLTALRYVHIPPAKIEEAVRTDNFDLIINPVIESINTALATYRDPEYVERLERENEELRKKVEHYERQLEEKERIIQDQRAQLSGMTSMLTNTQLQRFREWNNMRYAYGWGTLTPEQAQQVSFVPIPYNRDDQRFEHIMETAVTMKMLGTTFDNHGVSHIEFIEYAIETTDALKMLQKEIEYINKDMAYMWNSIGNLQNNMLKLVSSGVTQHNSSKQIVEVKIPPQKQETMDITQGIKYLQNMGYIVTPPPSEDRVREIAREVMTEYLNKMDTKGIIDAESMQIIMDGILKMGDKVIAHTLYQQGFITKQEFAKWAHLEEVEPLTIAS